MLLITLGRLRLAADGLGTLEACWDKIGIKQANNHLVLVLHGKPQPKPFCSAKPSPLLILAWLKLAEAIQSWLDIANGTCHAKWYDTQD